MKKGNLKIFPYGIWMLLFTLVPMGLICYYALTNPSGDFTLSNLYKMLEYSDVVLRSLLFAFIATVICLLLSYPFAYFMAQLKSRKQRTYLILLLIPMWSSLLLRTYAWMTILENNGLLNRALSLIGIGPFHMINTSGAVVLGMVYDFMPFMILPLYTAISRIDPSLLEAADDLGAGSARRWLHVVLPLSLPGILSGITMVFVPAASTFVISRLLGGGSSLLIGDLIEMQFVGNAYNPWFGAALSLFLMVVILLIMLVTRAIDKQHEEVSE